MSSCRVAEVYEVAEVNTLPLLDVKRSIRSVLFAPTTIKRLKKLHRALRCPIRLLYAAAVPVFAAVYVVSPRYAHLLAAVAVLMQLPMQFFDTISLRVEILACLVKTYEFWLFSFINTSSSILLALQFGDARVAVVPAQWYGVQMIIWADARIQSRTLAMWALLGMVYQCFLAHVFMYNLLPSSCEMDLFVYKSTLQPMKSDDFLVDAFLTLAVLMARTAYRKRVLSVKQRNNPMLVCFVSYRCRIKLQPHVEGPSTTDAPRLRDTRVTKLRSQQQLRLISLARTFDSRDIVWPQLAALVTEPSQHLVQPHIVLYLIGLIGATLNGVLFLGVYPLERIGFDFTAPAAIGLVCTAGFYLTFIACTQRQLLSHILTSFDFIFVSLQITLSHLCMADMLRWDARALTTLSAWLWMHWVITMDAITPAMRARLHWNNKLRIDGHVLGFTTVTQLLVILELVRWNSIRLFNRDVQFATIGGYELTFQSTPFIVGRATTLVLWTLRMLWRQLSSRDGALVVMQGNVQFYANPRALQTRSSQWRSKWRARFSVRAARLHPAPPAPDDLDSVSAGF